MFLKIVFRVFLWEDGVLSLFSLLPHFFYFFCSFSGKLQAQWFPFICKNEATGRLSGNSGMGGMVDYQVFLLRQQARVQTSCFVPPNACMWSAVHIHSHPSCPGFSLFMQYFQRRSPCGYYCWPVCVCVAVFIVGKHLPLGCSEREGGELTTSCVQLQLILLSSFLSLFMA